MVSLLLLILIAIYLLACYWYAKYSSKKYLHYDEINSVSTHSNLKDYAKIQKEYEHREEINILVLTGGGLRGYVPLEVLEYIEQETGKKTGELFDFVAGTSIGAITSAALIMPDEDGVGYKFSAAYLKINYINLVKKMFNASALHQILTLFGIFGPRYLSHGKNQIMNDFFGLTTIAELKKLFLVPVYDMKSDEVLMVRNWRPPYYQHQTNFPVAELIDGASNPNTLFAARKLIINEHKYVFSDPAFLVNNPGFSALINARLLFPDKTLRLVFIGNGGSDTTALNFNSMSNFGAMGLWHSLFNSPNINGKFSQDLIKTYIEESQHYDDKITFYNIDVKSEIYLSSVDTANQNIENIKKFAQYLLRSNKIKIDELITALKTTNE